MRRSKFVCKALLQSAASRLPASATASCCGCGATSTTGREVSGKSDFPQEVNRARASQNWVEVVGESRHRRDLVLARNEEDSSGRGDDSDGLRSAEEEKIDMEKVLLQVRKGIVERLDSLKLRASILPNYNISAKSQQVICEYKAF
ncbi:hypothetical protein R1flu_014922 [Riccia fluitans]|uniref:Uncharacterized protein n=1 Tax=Riccia fluitans TaxID=41844 RepID=A0ABD1YHG8_9MARC